MNVSEVMVQYLAAAGVRDLFGYPGDPNVEFMEAARREGMRFVLARREGTAGLMAEACGFLAERPGVCMTTLGPGSSNLVNAVANARLDRVPMTKCSRSTPRASRTRSPPSRLSPPDCSRPSAWIRCPSRCTRGARQLLERLWRLERETELDLP